MVNLQQTIGRLSERYGVSAEAVETLARALERGGGRLAQFDHPELGGYGQWMPGMIQIGDMFNRTLRERVENLCCDLSGALREEKDSGRNLTAIAPARVDNFSMKPMKPMKPMEGMKPMEPMKGMKAPEKWWPDSLGDSPNITGSQNDVRFAYFAAENRLAVQREGKTEVYDTTGHRVSGVHAHQHNGESTLGFNSDQGKMELDALKKVSG